MNYLNVKEWQEAWRLGEFKNTDRDTQIKAGWYDWFCKSNSLANRLRKIGGIVNGLKDGGKIDLEHTEVWFKNCCPCFGPLYDMIGLHNDNGTNYYISIDDTRNDSRFVVETDNGIIAEFNSAKELKSWLNAA